jgi:protocatechuate 3,4-dioxygenase beta subunit
MTRRIAISVVVLCAGFALSSGGALQARQQTPVRDPASIRPNTVPARSGTASIAGVVLDANSRPVRHAVVTLNGQSLNIGRTTVTSDEGRFVFVDLPAGRFNVEATKGGFLRSYHRGKRPGRPPAVPIPLADGQAVTGVSLQMLRAGVIAGRVTDDNGHPMFVGVQASLVQTINGRRTMMPQAGGYGYADDRGMYRIFGLVPGEYVVSAAPPRFSSTSPEVRILSAAELQRAEIAVREARAGAATAGAAPAASPTSSALAADVRTGGFATVYYPGTTDLATAATVAIEPGSERTDVDLRMTLVPMSSLAGTVVDAEGRPAAGVAVSLVMSGTTAGRILTATAAQDGTFSIASVSPGAYTAMARLETPTGAMWALTDVAVDGRDVDGVALRLQPGLTISGRVQIEDGSQAPPPFGAIKIQLDAERPERGATFGAAPVQPDATGAFRFTGVTPGLYRMSVSLPQKGAVQWALKSALIDGAEASDMPVSVRQDTTSAAVTLTDRAATLTGILQDASGAPSPEYSLVVFSADPRFWLPKARRLRGPIRPGADGRFLLTDLPPGDYFLAAVINIDAAELEDKALLEQLAASGVKVTLAAGHEVVQNIKIGG